MKNPASSEGSDLYAGYEQWKGWNKPFAVSAGERAYFEGELQGLKISGAEVLEIGFGSGSCLAWAREQGARVAGTEINEALLAAARMFGVDVLPADFERTASDWAGRFDTIVAFDVFEHFAVADVVTRLRAAETMLKPDGHIILRFPNAQSPFGLAPQNGDPTHKSALSLNVFEQLTQGMSFKVVRYGPSFRVSGRAGGGGLAKGLVRAVRYTMRDLIGKVLNFTYSQNIPWDPVVVLVMRRAGARQPGA
jgi:SAM-dependent methyltransferase